MSEHGIVTILYICLFVLFLLTSCILYNSYHVDPRLITYSHSHDQQLCTSAQNLTMLNDEV